MKLQALKETDEEMTALHEAGHCVGHLAVGWPPASATIIPSDEYTGRVDHDPNAARPDGDLEAIAFVGGPIAVDLVLSGGWVWREHGDLDFAGGWLSIWCKHYPPLPLSPEQDAAIDAVVKTCGIRNVATSCAALLGVDDPPRRAFARGRMTAACRLTERILRRRWPEVLALQRALLERKTLTGPEIVAIAAAAARQTPPSGRASRQTPPRAPGTRRGR